MASHAGPETRSAAQRPTSSAPARVSPPRLYSEVAQLPPSSVSGPSRAAASPKPQRQPASVAKVRRPAVPASVPLTPTYADIVQAAHDRVMEAFPDLDEVADAVAFALNSLLKSDAGESEFKRALFAPIHAATNRANRQARARRSPSDPEVTIDFAAEISLTSTRFAGGGGRPYEETPLFGVWSSAHDSARQIKQQQLAKLRRGSATSEKPSAIESPAGASTPGGERPLVGTPTPSAAAGRISNAPSQLLGPICPDLVCQVTVTDSESVESQVASTGVFEIKSPRMKAGTDEAKGSAAMHRLCLAQTIAYCQSNRQMGGLGMGIAICGSFISRVWAITETTVAVEVCPGILTAGDSQIWTVRRLFPRGTLRPLLAHSFLYGSMWQRKMIPRPDEINMDAVGVFRDYLQSCVQLLPRVVGPHGPRAMPAAIDPPVIDFQGLRIDPSGSEDTMRLYEILRGPCSLRPGATPAQSVHSASRFEPELDPSDSISETGLQDISEEMLDELNEKLNVLVVEEGGSTLEEWMRSVDKSLSASSAERDVDQ